MFDFFEYLKNKNNYNDLIDLLRKTLQHYQTYFGEYKQILNLSNGDTLKLEYLDKNFPHLMGVQTLYLIRECSLFDEFTSSYDALIYLLDHSDEIYDKIMNHVIDPNKLFSKYIFQKINSFLGMYHIGLENLLFACPYNKDLTKFTGTDISIDADYLLFLKNKDYPFSILGFRRVDDSYVAVTNIGIENNCLKEDQLLKILGYQTICYPVRMVIKYKRNSPKEQYLFFQERKEILSRLQFYKEQYFCHIDSNFDLLKQIESKGKSEESKKNFKRALQILGQNVQRRTNISEEEIAQFYDTFIVDIFENYNEVNNIIDENMTDYQEEILTLKEENTNLRSKNQALLKNRFHAVRIKKKR